MQTPLDVDGNSLAEISTMYEFVVARAKKTSCNFEEVARKREILSVEKKSCQCIGFSTQGSRFR